MNRFGAIRLVRENVNVLHKCYFLLFGVSCDHKLRFKYFKRALDTQFGHLPVRRILDAGCGTGDYSYYLAKKFPHAEVYGIDVDEKVIAKDREEQRKAGITNIRFLKHDLMEGGFEERFDLICCIDVLEHTRDVGAVVAMLLDHLTDDGVIFIHMPLRKERRPAFDRYLDEFHKWEEHEHVARPYSKSEFVSLVKSKNGRIIRQDDSFNHYLGEMCVSLTMLFYANTLLNNLIRSAIAPIMNVLVTLEVAMTKKSGNAIALLVRNEGEGCR